MLSTFGETLDGAHVRIIVRNWGALIALVANTRPNGITIGRPRQRPTSIVLNDGLRDVRSRSRADRNESITRNRGSQSLA